MQTSEQSLKFEDRVKDAKKRAELINNCEGDGDCPHCKGRGYFARVHVKGDVIYESEEQCQCQIKKSVDYHLNKSGLCNLEKYAFDKFIAKLPWQSKIKCAAEKFTKEDGRWFYIGGQSGGGKTHICTAMVKAMIEKGHSARYMLWEKEWAKIRSLANDERREGELSQWKDVDVLYIDDLFKHKKGEAPTGAEVMLAYEILNHRNINNLTTIMSSEYLIAEIMEFDEAVGGRIFEKCRKEYTLTIPRGKEQNMRVQMI